jgi:Fe-S oxidoreductase
VILWADTFNNYFHPRTAQAAVEVLEAAGFRVAVPKMNLCCGRPLYDWGMLNEAEAALRVILDTLKEPIEEGAPVVVLEPSCASVFRDELINFFPNDEDANRLSEQIFLLSEFLQKKAPHFKPPQLKRKAVVHGHCHHKSLMMMDNDEAVFEKMGWILRFSIRAVVGWPARLASSAAIITTCQSNAASAFCCPRCAMRAKRRSSSLTGSVAASRSRN